MSEQPVFHCNAVRWLTSPRSVKSVRAPALFIFVDSMLVQHLHVSVCYAQSPLLHFIDQENNANFTLIIVADLSKFNEFVVDFSRKSEVDLRVVGVVT